MQKQQQRRMVDPATGLEYRVQLAPLELSAGISQYFVAAIFFGANGSWAGSTPVPADSDLEYLGADELLTLLRKAQLHGAQRRTGPRDTTGARERDGGAQESAASEGGQGGSGRRAQEDAMGRGPGMVRAARRGKRGNARGWLLLVGIVVLLGLAIAALIRARAPAATAAPPPPPATQVQPPPGEAPPERVVQAR